MKYNFLNNLINIEWWDKKKTKRKKKKQKRKEKTQNKIFMGVVTRSFIFY
jgi:hypothetical protein